MMRNVLTGLVGLLFLPFVVFAVIVFASFAWTIRIFWDLTEGNFKMEDNDG